MDNLGKILRAKREERGLSVKDVEEALSIRVKYLEALEDENYSVIPGEVYVKGFLRNYAGFLNLDADKIVQMYKETHQPPERSEMVTKEKESPSNKKAVAYNGVNVKLPLIGIVILVIAGIVYYLFASHPAPNPPAPAPAPKAQAPLPGNVPAPQAPVKATIQGIKVVAKVKAECWAWVVADGKEIFEGTLHTGEVKTWEAKNNLELTLGNAGGVDVTVNDQPQAPLGAPGDVISKTYKAQ